MTNEQLSHRAQLRRLNRLLTEKQAYAVYLVVGCGLRHEEAGLVMGIERSGVTHLLKRAHIRGCYRHKFKHL